MTVKNNELLIQIIEKLRSEKQDNDFILHLIKHYPEINWSAKDGENKNFMSYLLETINNKKIQRVERKKTLIELTDYLLTMKIMENNEIDSVISFVVKNDYIEIMDRILHSEELKNRTLQSIYDNNLITFCQSRMLEYFSKNEEIRSNIKLSFFDLKNSEAIIKAIQENWGNLNEKDIAGRNLLDITIDRLFNLYEDEVSAENMSKRKDNQIQNMFRILNLLQDRILNDNMETFIKSFKIKSLKPALFLTLNRDFLQKTDLSMKFSYKEDLDLNLVEYLVKYIQDPENKIKKEVSLNNKLLATIEGLQNAFQKITHRKDIEDFFNVIDNFTRRNDILGEIITKVVDYSGLDKNQKTDILKKEFISSIMHNEYNKSKVIYANGLPEEVCQELLNDKEIIKKIFKTTALLDYFKDKFSHSTNECCYVKVLNLHKENRSITDNVIKMLSQYSTEEYIGMKQILKEEFKETYDYFFNEKQGRFVKNKKASVMDEKFELNNQLLKVQPADFTVSQKPRL